MTDIQVNSGDKLEIKVFRKTQSPNHGYVYDARNVVSCYLFYDFNTNFYSVTAVKSGYIRISGHHRTGQTYEGDEIKADYVIYKLTKTN